MEGFVYCTGFMTYEQSQNGTSSRQEQEIAATVLRLHHEMMAEKPYFMLVCKVISRVIETPSLHEKRAYAGRFFSMCARLLRQFTRKSSQLEMLGD